MAETKIMICGAGRVVRELLKRLGESWRVVLVAKDQEELDRTAALFPHVTGAFAEDPSSPVALEQAGLKDMDYLLAAGEDDEANLASAAAGAQAGVRHVLALYNESRREPQFAELEGVVSLLASAALARQIHRYLEDPEARVIPLSLGRGAVMELEAAGLPRVVGRRAALVRGPKWRLVGLIREGRLMLPDGTTRVREEDRLVVLGQADLFSDVCSELDCTMPGFPRALGQRLLLALAPEAAARHAALVSEALYWALNARLDATTILCDESACDIQEQLDNWPAASKVTVETVAGDVWRRVRELCAGDDVGLVVGARPEPGILAGLTGGGLFSLAASLGRPLLFAGGTMPYGRILVPFNAKPRSEAALNDACDLARQMGAEVHLAMVAEPEFLRGEGRQGWLDQVRDRARQEAHAQKLDLKELVLEGNPVKEVSAVSGEFDLMVLGGSARGRGLLAPNVGEHLARRAECSVLLVAWNGEG